MNRILLFTTDFIDSGATKVRLTGRRRDHALAVCGVSAGDTLRVGLLNGKIGTGIVSTVDPGFLEMTVELSALPPEPPPLTLALALPRPKVFKRCLEVATALGIKRIFVMESWRVEKSYWTSPVLAPDAIREHLLLGLEQSGDTALPVVEVRRRFRPFVEDELPEIIRGRGALVGHPAAVERCPFHSALPIVLAIGPEGGFIPFELDLLTGIGFTPVTLGTRILRVEQAIPAFAGRLF
jgi:RsmE family RNA methyltransferase